jgi:hypothetical protein
LSLSFIVLASLHFALLCGCLAPTLAGSLWRNFCSCPKFMLSCFSNI